MTAVQASEEEAAALIAGREDQVAIAVVNGPASVVLSGQAQVVAEMAAVLSGQGRRIRPLRVSHGFHSPLMDPMLDQFAEVAAGISYRPPRIEVVSGVTGQLVEAGQMCSAQYWVTNVRQAVRFGDAVLALRAAGAAIITEVGPGQVLSGIAAECLGQDAAQILAGPVLRDRTRRTRRAGQPPLRSSSAAGGWTGPSCGRNPPRGAAGVRVSAGHDTGGPLVRAPGT